MITAFCEIILVSGLLYGYYWIFLRNSRFHVMNRFYLLCSLVFSIVVPFIHVPLEMFDSSWPEGIKAGYAEIISTANRTIPALDHQRPELHSQNLTTFISSIYILVCIVLLFRIVVVFFRVVKLINKHPVKKVHGFNIVETSEHDAPFTFFKWLFWNTEHDINQPVSKQILKHESVHIRQLHTVDTVIAECIFALFWINPFFYLIKRELKSVHEFLADTVITDKPDFARHLLANLSVCRSGMMHNVFGSVVGRRIMMITGNHRKKYLFIGRTICLPVAIATVVTFSLDVADFKKLGSRLSVPALEKIWKTGTIQQVETAKSKKFEIPATKTINGNIHPSGKLVTRPSNDTMPMQDKEVPGKVNADFIVLNYRDNSIARFLTLPEDNILPASVHSRSDETQIFFANNKDKDENKNQLPVFFPASKYDELVLIFNKNANAPLKDEWRLNIKIYTDKGDLIQENSLQKEWITGYEVARIEFHDLPIGNYQLEFKSTDQKYTSYCKVIKDYDSEIE